MIEIEIPGGDALRLRHLVLDYNGTLAVDGALLAGVAERLRALAGGLEIHVVTADTFGRAREGLAGLPARLSILPPGGQDAAKERFVEELGPEGVAAVGNGRNDARMLARAALGIAVVLGEGAAAEALAAADVVAAGIPSALDLLLHPRRLTATLRR